MTRTLLLAGAVSTCALASGAAGAQSFLEKQPPRIDASATAPRRAVAPGQRLTVEIRVTPRPDIHVYAPDNPEYIPVSVSFRPLPGVTFGTPEYPKPEEYFFAPLAEVVKVYSDPFTIAQPVTLRAPFPPESADAGGRIVLEGTVRYQACDDKVCFPPQSVAVRATVTVDLEPR